MYRFRTASVWKSVRNIGYVFASLLLVTGGAMVLPIVCSLCYGNEGDLVPLLISASVALLIGLPLRFICRTVDNLQLREAFLIHYFWMGGHLCIVGIAICIARLYPFHLPMHF